MQQRYRHVEEDADEEAQCILFNQTAAVKLLARSSLADDVCMVCIMSVRI